MYICTIVEKNSNQHDRQPQVVDFDFPFRLECYKFFDKSMTHISKHLKQLIDKTCVCLFFFNDLVIVLPGVRLFKGRNVN
jgi:hypothetical protein